VDLKSFFFNTRYLLTAALEFPNVLDFHAYLFFSFFIFIYFIYFLFYPF
jgi:hypothetical protein